MSGERVDPRARAIAWALLGAEQWHPIRLEIAASDAGSTGVIRVGGIFAQLGYPEPVVRALTGLSTHRVPGAVLRAMPAGGDSTARYRLRALLRAAHLPQGSPTAPALANLACFRLDRRLAGYAERSGLVYTRYVDDLTFSGARCAVPAWLPGSAGSLPRKGSR
ncbi:reverse transcriptase domain-containing protein [Naumannella halotolerans]|uniref:reverse transcriptase domain-containing protein n=1 Tax=Naumannella halotolerans TaxID=993414 RepID=UPI00105C45A9|nr:reverse transcriptase domain-containing protein [Naumannella halotolerans]